MLVVKGFGFYDGMTIYKIFMVIAVVLIGMKLCVTNHTVIEWLFISALSFMGVIAYLNSKEKGILLAIMVIIGIKGVPIERLFKIGLVVWGSCFLVMNIAGVFDLVTGSIVVHDKGILGIVLRRGMGYPHPNVLHISYAFLVALILYLSANKQIWKYLALFAGNIYIFLYSYSYTGFLLVCIYMMIDIYLTYRKKLSRSEKIFMHTILPICMIFSIVGPLVLNLDGAIFQLINRLMNTRFFMSRVFLHQNQWSLFGTANVTQGAYPDSSYVILFLFYGIVFFVLFFVLHFVLINHCIKHDKRRTLTIVLAFIIAGFFEPFLVNTSHKNLIWLFVGIYIFDSVLNQARFSEHKLLGFSVKLFDKKDITIAVPSLDFAKGKSALSHTKPKWHKFCLLVALVVSFIAAALSWTGQDKSYDIYIDTERTDIGDDLEEFFLDKDNLPADFHGKIYAYTDAESPLYRIGSDKLSYEYVRKSVSIGLMFGVGFYLLAVCWLVRRGAGNGMRKTALNK
jgi:hypothetical protein